MSVVIGWHDGPRAELRPLFELAEDSVVQLDASIELGRMLVARTGAAAIGQLQLVPTAEPDETEIKNMGVAPEHQGTGPATGYPESLVIDGIPLLDRVWFSQEL